MRLLGNACREAIAILATAVTRRVLIALLTAAAAVAAPLPYYCVLSADAGAWPEILSSIGLIRQPANLAHVFVARTGTPASNGWMQRVEHGDILILEGESSLAEMFGFRRGEGFVKVASLTDMHRPGLAIVWEKGLDLPVFDLPNGATVFARERWTGAPMMAGLRRGSGVVLWVAVPPGERGYERFPYLLQALADLGMERSFSSPRLWAFFDSAYRSRVDLDYFAARWRASGVAALHVAAWHFWEADPEQDAYLQHLISACHREGILVYAWLELPHVSEKFWTAHPEWREKTAILQDAQLDWRKLMNLTNRDCFRAVADGAAALTKRFDWDGVNLAELYFESLEGTGNPARFTPMNDDVRREFRARSGFDPIDLFAARRDEASRKQFLDYRAELAGRMEEEWLAVLESLRIEKPDLDLVLTHVDDRFDNGMREAIGADAMRVLPLLDTRSFTFLIEDPATVWNLGPQRYPAIAERYRAITTHADKLAIDLNIVDRYQNVYPTKQQTGTELFELVHSAARSFDRVTLYFENSLLAPDLGLLPSAAATVTRVERIGPKLVVDSVRGVGVPWSGPAIVDGQPWPVRDAETVWLPAGSHVIEASPAESGPSLLRLNGELKAGRRVDGHSIEFTYRSAARAIAVLDRTPRTIEIDSSPATANRAGPNTLLLPRGQHIVTLTTE
ncbi:MAG: hypothetical protein ACLQKA_14545 [Bryobacteraceae bacterium]